MNQICALLALSKVSLKPLHFGVNAGLDCCGSDLRLISKRRRRQKLAKWKNRSATDLQQKLRDFGFAVDGCA